METKKSGILSKPQIFEFLVDMWGCGVWHFSGGTLLLIKLGRRIAKIISPRSSATLPKVILDRSPKKIAGIGDSLLSYQMALPKEELMLAPPQARQHFTQ